MTCLILCANERVYFISVCVCVCVCVCLNEKQPKTASGRQRVLSLEQLRNVIKELRCHTVNTYFAD
jgi:uncharacterized protein YqfB (UPF0267 family)